MKLRVEGSILLSKIDKEHAIYLISNFNEEQIANMYDVSVTVVRDRMAEKMEEYMIPEKLKNHIYKPEKVKFQKTPFSKFEDDYGLLNKEVKQMVTREGLLIFDGVAPLKDPGETPLQKIIKIYKKSIANEKEAVETNGGI
jgi:hypothetical protein